MKETLRTFRAKKWQLPADRVSDLVDCLDTIKTHLYKCLRSKAIAVLIEILLQAKEDAAVERGLFRVAVSASNRCVESDADLGYSLLSTIPE